MADVSTQILMELRQLQRSLRRPVQVYTGAQNLPPLAVYYAAEAAGKHTPVRHRTPMDVPVVGSLDHMRGSVYAKICSWLGLSMVDARQAGPGSSVGFVWNPHVFAKNHDLADALSHVRRLSPDIHLINDTGFSDDKRVLQRTFADQFGYALEVDPLVHRGPAVAKSRANATHDGRLIECPIDAVDETLVYQVAVDNVVDGDLAEDLRISIVNYMPVLCYLKYRPTVTRFSNRNTYARVAGVFDVCSQAEFAKLVSFTRTLGLEIGEIDALRDRGTGRLYVVDANNTPSGPPNSIEIRDHDIAIRWLSDAFLRSYLACAA